MLLCYMYRNGNEPEPELCLVAERLDQFSPPVSIDSLQVSDAAVIRIGPLEAINVSFDSSDNGVIINPCIPAHLYLSPPQPDLPGLRVTGVKIVKLDGAQRYQTYFKMDKEEWREFTPARDCR